MHVAYNGASHKIKVYRDDGALVFSAECRNDSVADNAWRPDAGCPPGSYSLGAPETNDPGHEQTEMGPWFIPVLNILGHDGIGIHGGGSCVTPDSMNPYQGWCPTLNCFRMQNADLETLVKLIPDGGSSFTVYQTP